MKTAYIKFCGGCNATYDRVAAAQYLKQALSNKIEFFTHEPGVRRDLGVLIMGCSRECVRPAELSECGRLFRITSMQDAADVVSELSSEVC